ncbi:MAG: response regulator [Planctomycetota bacterium]|nr:response regulator [Planctomycetota bacterium]MDA1163869.1 response regulator [Planctomycetota bacterium]
MTDHQPTVFIVDDDSESLDSVRTLICVLDVPVKTFSSAEAFLEAYDGEPGCLVTDLRLPGLSGVELLEQLSERDQLLPAIVISGYADVSVTVEAMQQGALTLLEKPYRENDLWKTVGIALAQDLRTRALRQERNGIRCRLTTLTPDERSVLELIVDGIPNKMIAEKLDVGLRTVEARRRTILNKMSVKSIAGLARDFLIANDLERPIYQSLQARREQPPRDGSPDDCFSRGR